MLKFQIFMLHQTTSKPSCLGSHYQYAIKPYTKLLKILQAFSYIILKYHFL